MNSVLRRLAAWCGAGAVACGLLAACVSTPEGPATPPAGAKVAPAPSVKVGEYWEYAVRDRYTGFPRGLYRYTVSRVDPDRVVVDLTRDGARIDTFLHAPDWNGLEHPLRNIQRFRYSPAFPAYVFPLYPGQTWRRIVSSTDVATGRSYRTHVHASVGEWRRIRVPAGEFDALEVRRRIYAGNAESFRLQEEIDEIDWYAPAIGQVVLSEGNSSHIDTSRTTGRFEAPLRVRGDWLVAELVRHSTP